MKSNVLDIACFEKAEEAEGAGLEILVVFEAWLFESSRFRKVRDFPFHLMSQVIRLATTGGNNYINFFQLLILLILLIIQCLFCLR
jgi:hypothetical protein